MTVREYYESGFVDTNSIQTVTVPITDNGLPTGFPRSKVEGYIGYAIARAVT